ncbi:MAG: DNA polymerase III subunit beta [candidate division Zixibacteria bacterium]|nr:DNA polymerase III subunit beta [candidate division Zixibacteria bacterium]
MKFTISQDRLHTIVQKVLNIVPARSTLPVLSNVLVEVTESKLSMKATDLDISITSECQADVSKGGQITIPGRMFAELVRELPAGDITVSSADNRIEVKSEKGVYKLSGISAEEFPKLPDIDLAKEVKIPGNIFQKMIKKTSFSASRDETRPALNGILWRTEADKFTMVATNGHMLSKYTRNGISLQKLKKDIIVSPKALDYFTKLFGDSNADIGLIFSDDNLAFILDDTVLTTRLLDGPYPNFEQVIPKENDKKLIVEKGDFLSLVRRVAILSNNITHQVKLSFTKSRMVISATNFDVGGEAQDELAIDYKGDDIEIGYNANYIIEILKNVDTPQLVMELSGPTAAGIIKAVSYEENEDYLFLVMPLRLTE